MTELKKLAWIHGISLACNIKSNELNRLLLEHTCNVQCPEIISVFEQTTQQSKHLLTQVSSFDSNVTLRSEPDFPPHLPTDNLVHRIITDWVNDSDSSCVEEVGCAVCGQLKPRADMNQLKTMKNYLHVLTQPGVTRKQRKYESDIITDIPGPVLDPSCDQVCSTCRKSLREGNIPRISLANGLWLGEVPPELQNLNFMERLLIQKMRTNCCFFKVSSGMRKMISHVIAFETPVAKVYN
ncbi:hypothetical protein K435DRAFT_689192, partial [Dendrothele bispora CBS 962.96]